MRFRNDFYLKRVAAAKAVPASSDIVAVELCNRLIEAGMIEDDEDGMPLARAIGQCLSHEVVAVLAAYLYGDASCSVPSDVFDAFCSLVTMGEGDCPFCGGDLRFVDTEGHDTNDGDYWTPSGYVIDYCVYECTLCGETTKIENI